MKIIEIIQRFFERIFFDIIREHFFTIIDHETSTLNVLSFECVIFLFYVDVNRKFLRRKTDVNVKLFFITFFEFYTSYLFFILKKIFIVVENIIQIFMTFAF
jgi:hypothetical protein